MQPLNKKVIKDLENTEINSVLQEKSIKCCTKKITNLNSLRKCNQNNKCLY